MKGDLSVLGAPGATGGTGPKRAEELGLPFEPASYPVEYLSLGGIGPGVPIRATVSDFGPQLLGNRVQHALRAHTPQGAKALKATVSTYPKSHLYELEELLTELGIGEAAVTILSAKGVPTAVAHTRLRPPRSRMSGVDDVEAKAKASPLYAKYGTRVDAPSAREALAARLEGAKPANEGPAKPTPSGKKAADAVAGGTEAIKDFLGSSTGKTITREIVRGVFDLLKKRR